MKILVNPFLKKKKKTSCESLLLEPRKSFKKSEILFIYLIVLHEKFLQFDWLRAVVFQLNLKYLHVKITNLLRVVV